MTNTADIKVDMTATRFTFYSEYQVLKRASGMEFLLLKMVDVGNRIEAKLKLSDMMNMFYISDDLVPFVIEEMKDLQKKKMLKIGVENINRNTPVKMVSIEDSARKLCDSGFVIASEETVSRRMLYLPFMREQFMEDDDRKEEHPVYKSVPPDDFAFAKYFSENLGLFGIGRHDKVTSLRIEHISDPDSPKAERSFTYSQEITLTFDGDTASFYIDDDLNAADPSKVKEAYAPGTLFDKIPQEVFEIDSVERFKVDSWDSAVREGCTLRLPIDFHAENSMLVYGSKVSDVTMKNSLRTDADFGCDAVLIEDRDKGYLVDFVTADLGMFDSEEKWKRHMVSIRPIGNEGVTEILNRISEPSKTSSEDLEKLNKFM